MPGFKPSLARSPEHPVRTAPPSATQTDDGPRYEVRLRLLSRPDELRLGMNATVYVP